MNTIGNIRWSAIIFVIAINGLKQQKYIIKNLKKIIISILIYIYLSYWSY